LAEQTKREFVFEENGDDLLTTDEANNIINNLYINLDEGSGEFENDKLNIEVTITDDLKLVFLQVNQHKVPKA